MQENFSVKEVAALLGYKNEETIKRKIKAGMFPNAFQNSRKEGWKIPASDIATITGSSPKNAQSNSASPTIDNNKSELIKLAYQVATLTSPPKEVHEVLATLSLERALEICLIIRQQNKIIEDPYKFVKASISKNWAPDPISNVRKKRLVDLTQQEYEMLEFSEKRTLNFPFYNWLEEK